MNVHVASKDIKKKFRFPTSDPVENSIVDNRTDSEKVADIL